MIEGNRFFKHLGEDMTQQLKKDNNVIEFIDSLDILFYTITSTNNMRFDLAI